MHGRCRRVVLVAACPGEGRLTELIAGVRPRRSEPALMPVSQQNERRTLLAPLSRVAALSAPRVATWPRPMQSASRQVQSAVVHIVDQSRNFHGEAGD